MLTHGSIYSLYEQFLWFPVVKPDLSKAVKISFYSTQEIDIDRGIFFFTENFQVVEFHRLIFYLFKIRGILNQICTSIRMILDMLDFWPSNQHVIMWVLPFLHCCAIANFSYSVYRMYLWADNKSTNI